MVGLIMIAYIYIVPRFRKNFVVNIKNPLIIKLIFFFIYYYY